MGRADSGGRIWAWRRTRFVVGDRKGESRRFPLKQGTESPAEFVMVMSEPMGAFRSQAVILDGKGEALAISHVGDWDGLELEEFINAAGLTQQADSLTAPMENLRGDGLIIEDATWFKWVPVAGTLTLLFSLLTGSGVLPAALGWVIVLALAGYVVTAFASGAFSKGRRGKGADQEDAYMATGDSSVFDEPAPDPDREPDS
jgi:hypothetical protein